MQVGDRFTQTTRHPWTSGHVRGVHEYELLCEVTVVDDVSGEGRLRYDVVQVLDETGRPPFDHVRPPHEAGFTTPHFADLNVEKGEWILVEE